MSKTLAEALMAEHVAIDVGISAFTTGIKGGEPQVETMLDALRAHRRHIYLEEKFLFPPLRMSGMFAAILVMLREHGEMWNLMDELEPLVAAGGTDPRIPEMCERFVAMIDAHNEKEEATIYSGADKQLSAPATAELREFMESGVMPEGWVCEKA